MKQSAFDEELTDIFSSLMVTDTRYSGPDDFDWFGGDWWASIQRHGQLSHQAFAAAVADHLLHLAQSFHHRYFNYPGLLRSANEMQRMTVARSYLMQLIVARKLSCRLHNTGAIYGTQEAVKTIRDLSDEAEQDFRSRHQTEMLLSI